MTTIQAKGGFKVTMNSEPLSEVAATTTVARMSLDKQYDGDLQGTGKGEMLAFRSSTQGSAGYVAMEVVTGSLHGRSGSFVLQHSSTMTRGEPLQSVTVVPDSGTDGLTGLKGSLVIIVGDGKHRYEFEYSLE
jgi:hypothetical protein